VAEGLEEALKEKLALAFLIAGEVLATPGHSFHALRAPGAPVRQKSREFPKPVRGVRRNFSKLKKALIGWGFVTRLIVTYMSTPTKPQILEQIAAIPAMERGKLSAYSFKDRPGHAGPYHKLQQWEEGKNHTRYVPEDEVPAVETALAGYAHYERLTRQYADIVVAETRQNIASKKKTSRPKSASPRKRKSNN
jgi:hypothetical protein